MFSSQIGTALMITGFNFGTATIFKLILSVIGLGLLQQFENPLRELIAGHIKNARAKRIVGNRFFSIAVVFIVGVLIVGFASASSTLDYVQPNAFVGWETGSPFNFGRHVASVDRQTMGRAQYCAQAHVNGDIKNVTNQPISVKLGSGVDLFSSQPNVSFNFNVTIVGLDGRLPTVIGPGEAVAVLINGFTEPSDCGTYTKSDLNRLLDGRMNATGNLIVQGVSSDSNTPTVTLKTYRFESLPIASGTL